jgi:hypothetical protein
LSKSEVLNLRNELNARYFGLNVNGVQLGRTTASSIGTGARGGSGGGGSAGGARGGH